jgi:predicted nucleic acid-binding protein
MILVADSSALIALSICDSLYLLDSLFGEVLVPETVFWEVTRSDKPEAKKLEYYLHGKTRKVDMNSYVFLDAFADAGETEAMLLYKQISAYKMLIDDSRGRKVAKINNIKTIGSLGVLLSAKKAGLIPAITPFIDLLAVSQIYISPSLIQTVLSLAGESQ